MKQSIKASCFLFLAAVIMIYMGTPVLSEDKPADNMEIVKAKVQADKKLLVASNMDLTESEAKGFWPVYDAYQKDLGVINQRIAKLIDAYAADCQANTLNDEKAKELVTEMVAIGKAEAELQASYVPQLYKVLPPKKVARYLQIENKVRAIVKYELARKVPLIP